MSEEESGPLRPSARFDRVCTSEVLKGFARLSSFLCLYSTEKEIYFIRFSLEFLNSYVPLSGSVQSVHS